MFKKYWDEKFETMNEGAMKAFQLEKLKETVKWVYDRIPFYKKAFDDKGVKPSDLQSLEDMAKFPFTILPPGLDLLLDGFVKAVVQPH